MSLILQAIIVFFGINAWAQSYQFVPTSEYPAMAVYEVGKKLARNGFYELDLKRKGQIFRTTMDQIYLHSGSVGSQAVLILDLKYNSQSQFLKISDTEYVCHAETSTGRPFSLYLKVDSEQDFLKICNSFLNTKKTQTYTSKLQQIMQLFIRPSYASDPNCNDFKSQSSNLGQLTASLKETAIIQGLGTCLSEVLRGSVQTFSGYKDSLVALLKDPKEFWQEISQQASALKNFLIHIKNEVIELKKLLSDLDSDLLVQMGCHLGGEILTSIGLGALTGVGLAKLSTVLGKAVVKLKEMPLLLTRLNHLHKTGKGAFAREVLSCVTSR